MANDIARHFGSYWITDLERSDCGRVQPCYRYIRQSDRLPRLDQLLERTSSPIAKIKLFAPDGAWTWYLAAYDAQYRVCWGATDKGRNFTTGTIAMDELVRLRTPRLGLPVERDLSFEAKPIAQLAALWLTRRMRHE